MRNHSTRKCGWIQAALMLAMLMPAIGWAQGGPQIVGPVQVVPEAKDIKYVTPRPLDQVIATSDQGDLTMKTIMTYCVYNHMIELSGLNEGMINQLPDDMLTRIATHIVTRKAASEALSAKGAPEEIKKAEEGYDKALSRIVIGQMIKVEVTDKMTSPTAEMIQAYYDKRKFEYVQPFSFKMRHLILLTYEPYVVKAGDTLESIARNVCGDPTQVDNIRSDDAQRPLRKTEAEGQPPLYEGEKLLVPMPANRAEAVRARLEDILKQMDQGKTFEQLAEEYSEGMMKGQVIGPLPSGTKEMLPDLIAIAKETPAGQVSTIFRTKHGYQAIQVVEKQEEHQKTLAEVRGEVIQALRSEEQNKLLKELIDKLYANPNLQINHDMIAKGDTLKPEDVIARLGDKEFTWAEAQKLWDTNGRPHTEKLIDEKVMRALPPLQIALAEAWAKPILDSPDSPISEQLAYLKPEKVGQGYIELLARQAASKQIDDAAVQAFYDANKAKYFSVPPAVKFITMVMVVPPSEAMSMTPEQLAAAMVKVKEALAEKLKGVHSVDDFVAMADTVNKTIIDLGVNPPGTDGKFMPIDKLEQPIAEAIKPVQAGQWSEPFQYADRSVMSVLVQDKQPETFRPFEEVRDQARMLAEKAVAEKEMGEIEARFAKDAHLQIKL